MKRHIELYHYDELSDFYQINALESALKIHRRNLPKDCLETFSQMRENGEELTTEIKLWIELEFIKQYKEQVEKDCIHGQYVFTFDGMHAFYADYFNPYYDFWASEKTSAQSETKNEIQKLLEKGVVDNNTFVIIAHKYLNMDEGNCKVAVNNLVKGALTTQRRGVSEHCRPLFCTHLELWEWFIEYFKCAENRLLFYIKRCKEINPDENFPAEEDILREFRICALKNALIFMPATIDRKPRKSQVKEIAEIYLNVMESAPANGIVFQTNFREVSVRFYDNQTDLRSSRRVNQSRRDALLVHPGLCSNTANVDPLDGDLERWIQDFEQDKREFEYDLFEEIDIMCATLTYVDPWHFCIKDTGSRYLTDNDLPSAANQAYPIDQIKEDYAIGKIPKECLPEKAEFNVWR